MRRSLLDHRKTRYKRDFRAIELFHALDFRLQAALACIDYVAVNEWSTAVETIGVVRPDIYVKGSEYEDHSRDLTGKIRDEVEAVVKGGRLRISR